MGNRLAKAGADLVSLSEKIDTTSATGKMIFRLLASPQSSSVTRSLSVPQWLLRIRRVSMNG